MRQITLILKEERNCKSSGIGEKILLVGILAPQSKPNLYSKEKKKQKARGQTQPDPTHPIF
jgi:hypothetical protein